MKNLLLFLICASTFFLCTGCGSKKDRKIIKEDQVFEHEIKMGTIDSIGTLISAAHYNEEGKVIEEIEYSKGNNDGSNIISSKTTYKYNLDGKQLEKTQYKFDRLHYKKINEYNKAGKKCLVKIYFGEEANTKDLPLWAAMRIYYNEFNKPSMKKWIGGINQFEEESSVSYNSLEGKLEYSKTDSSYATYHYGKNQKIDTIKVYLSGRTTLEVGGSDLGYDEIYIYKYDKNDSLIEKIQPYLTKTYSYANGKLLQEKEISKFGGWTTTKKYNDLNEYDEFLYEVLDDEKLNYKKKFEYNDNKDVIRQTTFNYLNEPIFHASFKYKYY